MRISSLTVEGQPILGIRTAEGMVNATALVPGIGGDLRALLERGPGALADLAALAERARTATGTFLLAPSSFQYRTLLPDPRKFLCLGLNYADHAVEAAYERPAHPVVFARMASSLTAHEGPMVLPRCSSQLDYEAEVAVVIGKRGRYIPRESALDWVAGYTLFNDGSIRDYQKRTHQWTLGKNFDTTGPLGPELITPDELPAAVGGLRIQMRVNGDTVQDASTSDMIFGVAEVVAHLSEAMTLEPGDVIAMGTPSGVGAARKPPRFLRVGDVCEVEVERMGVLRNVVVAES
jgi:2-keto-4-pentenoate hydratase/2-oxohepta-3-ene-1,7-dioic acid hydratase in catechol pathway